MTENGWLTAAVEPRYGTQSVEPENNSVNVEPWCSTIMVKPRYAASCGTKWNTVYGGETTSGLTTRLGYACTGAAVEKEQTKQALYIIINKEEV